MTGERYVVLGLARARSVWFGAVAQWAHSGGVPAEFVKCVSAEELRARLASGRPFSALLVDAGHPSLDRDLVDAAHAAGCAAIAVDDRRSRREWDALGVVAVLPDFFDPKALVEVLRQHAVVIGRGDALPGRSPAEAPAAWQGRIVAVCGPGGTGVSTVAIALAQGLAMTHPRAVLLADLALHAEQAMLHDARDVVPGVEELVEAHRTRRLPPDEVRALAFSVDERGYDLLLGLRQARAWAALRPRAFEAAFDSLTAAYQVVVCDTDADVEGEDEGGSIEVEERHVMSRTAVLRADMVLAVGLPGLKGVHSLVRVLHELRAVGVSPGVVVPVINRAPRHGRARAELTATLSRLTGGAMSAAGPTFAPPVFLPERRVDDLHADGVRLPDALTAPLTGAYGALAAGGSPVTVPPAGGPRPVRPGSLGSWSGDADEAALG